MCTWNRTTSVFPVRIDPTTGEGATLLDESYWPDTAPSTTVVDGTTMYVPYPVDNGEGWLAIDTVHRKVISKGPYVYDRIYAAGLYSS